MTFDTVGLKTGSRDKAGTDLDVEIRLWRDGIPVTGWLVLDNRGDDRERGNFDTYEIPFKVGRLSNIDMRVKHEPGHVDDDVWYDAWYLEWVYVTTTDDWGNRVTYVYKYNRWIIVPQGDRDWHVIRDFNFQGTIINSLAYGPVSSTALEGFLQSDVTAEKATAN